MKIVIAPDSFKESLSARMVCEAIARGIRRVHPDAMIDMVPMADGGEGTVDALVAATGGRLCRTFVTGPLNQPVEATWGILGGEPETAVLEMASASGLALVPVDQRNPLVTTTYGTGELLRAALNAGVKRIIAGIGGSATNDGGVGAAQAMGVAFLNNRGQPCPVPLTGGALFDVASIDVGDVEKRLRGVTLSVACDVANPLCGPLGAVAVYAPHKGATPDQVVLLDRNLAHLAAIVKRDLGKDILNLPGGGAAGGLGAGMVAFLKARLQSGVQIVMEATRLADRIADADLVITGEGRIDRQSMMGKVIGGVGQAARKAGVPVIALVGCVGQGAEETLTVLSGFYTINPPNMPLREALTHTAAALEATAATIMSKGIT